MITDTEITSTQDENLLQTENLIQRYNSAKSRRDEWVGLWQDCYDFVQNTLSWISSVLAMGPEAAASIDMPAAARFLGKAMAVPSDLIRSNIAPEALPDVQAIEDAEIQN